MIWTEGTLGNLFDLYQAQTITTKDLIEDGEYQVYGANGVIGRYDKFNHEEPQLLVACRGTCGAVNVSSPFAWINGNAMVVKPKKNDIDIKFVEYFFRGAVDLSKAITGAAQPQITRQSLSPIKFSYPLLATQQKIVERLDAIFAEIDKATAAAEANAKNAEALFESSVNEVFELYGNSWKSYSFDELVAEKLIGLVKNTSEQIEDGRFRYFKMNNISNDNKCNLSKLTRVNATPDEHKKFKLMDGDFLFNTRNSVELVGKTCVFEGDGKSDILFNNNIMRVRFKPSINPCFILFSFFSKDVKLNLEKMKSGTTNVAAIYYKDLKELKIKLPKLDVQNEFYEKFIGISSYSSSLKKNYENKFIAYNKLKQSILKQAFAGELVKE